MKCEIISEIGWSHIGDMELAKKMILKSKECGADFVKFQTWSASKLKPGEWDNDGRREIYEKAELSKEKHVELYSYCKQAGIKFMTSIFNHSDIENLPPNYTGCIKIPSTEIVNLRLIEMCKERFDHIIVSTGASSVNEVSSVLDLCQNKCTLMHCVSMYPCALKYANLKRILYLKLLTDNVGYSDHTEGSLASIYAISNGCKFVEKHFTTDSSLPGRDNKFAATPNIMSEICQARDLINCMTSNFTPNYQKNEDTVRAFYRGRWGGK